MTDPQQAIREVAAAYTKAWNAHDASGFSALFVDDADFVTFQGLWLKGRAAIQKAHQFIFDGPFKNTKLGYLQDTVALRGTDAAVMRAKWELTGAGPDGTPFQARSGMFLFVLQHTADGWRLVAGQNTDIDAQPMVYPAA